MLVLPRMMAPALRRAVTMSAPLEGLQARVSRMLFRWCLARGCFFDENGHSLEGPVG
jgi:hypothetical protein